MKVSIKLFIHLAIIVIIAILNYPALVQAKPKTNLAALFGMNEPPQKQPEFGSTGSRGELYRESRIRNRRQAPSGETGAPTGESGAPPVESDAPKQYQQEIEKNRNKRQIPSPPGDMPMPPI